MVYVNTGWKDDSLDMSRYVICTPKMSANNCLKGESFYYLLFDYNTLKIIYQSKINQQEEHLFFCFFGAIMFNTYYKNNFWEVSTSLSKPIHGPQTGAEMHEEECDTKARAYSSGQTAYVFASSGGRAGLKYHETTALVRQKSGCSYSVVFFNSIF